MKKIDSMGLKLAGFQASVFSSSLDLTSCSSGIFIRRFMNSELAKRMDRPGFLFDAMDVRDAISEIEEQYGESSYGSERYSQEELYWIGYIYRYWAYTDDKSSKQLYKKVKPDTLRKLYFPYHSLDPQQAIERIAEDFFQEEGTGLDNIARGVIALRKVRGKERKMEIIYDFED